MITWKLILAIIAVESGGNDNAVGYYDGRPVEHGPMQITQAAIMDVNSIAGTSYTIEDAYDRKKSVEIFTIYVTYYASPKRLKRQPTQQDIARIWNGGPSGHRFIGTVPYWRKVQAELAKASP